MVNVEKLDKGRLIFIWVGGGVLSRILFVHRQIG